ncbi:MAG: site-specific integrase [Proteobacteria bacterium]|nr:site-specific integrase [Pseudomonadota bacterium]
MTAARKFIRTKHVGVYYRESSARVHSGKPDRAFVVWYIDAQKKGHWHTVGWMSEGITERYAIAKRQELLGQVAQGKSPALRRSYTVGDAVMLYSDWARAEGKGIDIEMSRYQTGLKADLDAVPVASITTHMLSQLKAKLLKRLAPGSVKHCFSFIRRCIYHAISESRYSGTNPLATKKDSKWKMPRVQNDGVRYFSPEEARNLLAELAKTSALVHDMSLLSLKTGLRSTEIFSIRRQDIDKDAGLIHFTGKDGDREFVHATEDIIEMLLAYKRKPGSLVFQAKNGGELSWGIPKSFERAVARLKFNEGVTDPRHKVWFHTWRHTFASWLAQSGQVTLLELKEAMRHKSIAMTERYAHLIPGHQKKLLPIIGQTLQGDPTPES